MSPIAPASSSASRRAVSRAPPCNAAFRKGPLSAVGQHQQKFDRFANPAITDGGCLPRLYVSVAIPRYFRAIPTLGKYRQLSAVSLKQCFKKGLKNAYHRSIRAGSQGPWRSNEPMNTAAAATNRRWFNGFKVSLATRQNQSSSKAAYSTMLNSALPKILRAQ